MRAITIDEVHILHIGLGIPTRRIQFRPQYIIIVQFRHYITVTYQWFNYGGGVSVVSSMTFFFNW